MTVIKHPEQRVAVLIDAQNLYHSAKNLYGRKVNFEAVLKESVAGRRLVRAAAYVITSEAGDESSFFEALEKVGIETKTKDLQVFAGGAKKADWDVGLAIDGITAGLAWVKAAEYVVVSGKPDKADLEACWNLGATLAAQLMG